MAEEIILRYGLNEDYLYKGGQDHEIICRLDIEPAEAYRMAHPTVACDVCLALDGSGSMNEPFGAGAAVTKRKGVMEGAKSIVSHLDPADTVSLVFYDSRAYTVGECLPGSRGEEIRRLIDTLERYSGATNFEAALGASLKTLSRGRNPSRRIIFLTDGQANQGNKKAEARMLADSAREGITIDCLGVGGDFNFHFMRGLSGPSNGRTFLLSTPEEASRRFEELLVSAQKAVAGNVFLTALFPAGLRDVEAYQWLPEMRYYGAPRPGPDGRIRLEINVQTVRQDRRNIFFFKARMDPSAAESTRLFANIRLDFDLPPARKTGVQESLNIHVNFSDTKDRTEYDTDVENGFAEVELAKLDKAFQESRQDDWKKAAAILDEMIRRARTLGDARRMSDYLKYMEKLKTEHRLSDDDYNRVGSLSSVSTQTQEGCLPDPRENDVRLSLQRL